MSFFFLTTLRSKTYFKMVLRMYQQLREFRIARPVLRCMNETKTNSNTPTRTPTEMILISIYFFLLVSVMSLNAESPSNFFAIPFIFSCSLDN